MSHYRPANRRAFRIHDKPGYPIDPARPYYAEPPSASAEMPGEEKRGRIRFAPKKAKARNGCLNSAIDSDGTRTAKLIRILPDFQIFRKAEAWLVQPAAKVFVDTEARNSVFGSANRRKQNLDKFNLPNARLIYSQLRYLFVANRRKNISPIVGKLL